MTPYKQTKGLPPQHTKKQTLALQSYTIADTFALSNSGSKIMIDAKMPQAQDQSDYQSMKLPSDYLQQLSDR